MVSRTIEILDLFLSYEETKKKKTNKATDLEVSAMDSFPTPAILSLVVKKRGAKQEHDWNGNMSCFRCAKLS